MNLQEVLIPENGLIREYIDIVKEFTDAPILYHLFCSLIILGASMGGRVWIPFGDIRLYPNLYICLLGQSGAFRKSTCINNVRRVLEKFEEELIVPDEFTMEWLLGRLQEKPNCLFLWSEFGAIISYFNKQYMAGAKEMFTRLYDCPQRYRREIKSVKYDIRDVTPSILAASTPEWLFRNMTESDLLGGFFGRFLYIIPTKKEKFIALPDPVDEGWVNRITIHLNELKRVEGPVDLGKSRAAYEEFAKKFEEESEKSSDGELRQAFFVRDPVSVLKFAMIYNLSMGFGLKMSSEAMTKAILLGEFLKGSLEKAIENDLALTPEMKNKMKVLKMIKREPGILHSKLLKNSHLTSYVLSAVLNQLVEEERIYNEGTGVSGNPKKYYAK